MSLVVLASGGVDSTLVCAMAVEAGVDVYPCFINYGQLAAAKEWSACQAVLARLNVMPPTRVDVSGFGAAIPSGLTSSTHRLREDAFLPGRNMLLLTIGASYAATVGASGVAIGLLRPEDALFGDQRPEFLASVQATLQDALSRPIRVLAPLISMSKADVLALAAERGLTGTYSCHAGTAVPCGRCVSCLERSRAEAVHASGG
jgi:7-cyano-7-deazaguanine synthase